MTPEQFFETPTGVMTCEQAHSLAKLAFLAGRVCAAHDFNGPEGLSEYVIAQAEKWKAFYDSQKVTV